MISANATGEIIVTLVDDTGVKDYTLSDTTSERSATVSMIRVPLPLLTISNDGNAVTEGDEATFTISADADPKA